MRIAITMQSLHHLGGIGTYTRQLLGHLLELDKTNEYILIYPSFGKAKQSFGQYKGHKVTEVYSQSLIPHGNYWDHFVVPYVARRHHADLVFNPFVSIPLFGRFKKVFVAHNSEWFTMPEVFRTFNQLTGSLRMKALLRTADIVISVSQKVAEDLIHATGLSRSKFRVIYNAPGKEFTPITDTSRLAAVQGKYALPEAFLLFVGGIYPQKNFGGLLTAFAEVAPHIPHHLVVAGNSRWKSSRELDLIQRLGLEDRVQLIGWIKHDELPALYNLATAFLIPSFHESCSVALLEALACGCPIIASNTGGNPEVVADAALMVDPRNTEALKQAMLEVVSQPALRQELAQKALKRAPLFTWEKAAQETLQVFKELS
jgi:glycosyltransferase involved in cell wall biosynthesis